jgi:hypothetical protein
MDYSTTIELINFFENFSDNKYTVMNADQYAEFFETLTHTKGKFTPKKYERIYA